MASTTIAKYQGTDGRFSYELTESEGYYSLYQSGELDQADAKHMAATLKALRERLGRPYALLMPLPAEFRNVTAEARRIMAGAVLADDSPLRVFSVFGGNVVMRTLFNLYARVTTVPMRISATEQEAVEWIRAKTQGDA